MRKIEIEWTTIAGAGAPYHGVAKVYTGSGSNYTEVGEITIRKENFGFVTLPAGGQEFQPDTISGTDRDIMQEMAEDYYDGTNTSGVMFRII